MARLDLTDTRSEAISEDYDKNMFRDGKNRTATNDKAKKAPDYDRVAHNRHADVPGERG